MYDEEKFKPIRRHARETGIEDPFVDIIDGARQIENSSNEILRSLQAIPSDYLDSVEDLVTRFNVAFFAIKITLVKLLEKNEVNEKNLDKANDLLEELKELKNQIDTKLIESVETNPATGLGDELAVLPTGEVIKSEEISKKFTTEKVEYWHEIAKEYKFGRSFIDDDGSLLPLVDNLKEARSVLIDVGYGEGKSILPSHQRRLDGFRLRIEHLYNDLRRLDSKSSLTRESRERERIKLYSFIEEEYEHLGEYIAYQIEHSPIFPVSQDTIDLATSPQSIEDEPVLVTFTQHIDNVVAGDGLKDVVDTVVDPVIKPDLSNVPTLDVNDIVHDPLITPGPFKGIGNSDALRNTPNLTGVVDNLLDSKKDIEEIDYQFVFFQANLMRVVSVLSGIGLSSNPDLEMAEKLISDYKNFDTDTLQTLVNKSEYLLKFKDLLEKIRLVKIKGDNDGEIHFARIIELDDDQVLVERISSPGSKITAQWVTLAELKELNSSDISVVDAVNDLPVTASDATIADNIPITTDTGLDNMPVDDNDPVTADVLSSIDDVTATSEASVVEVELTTDEALVKEKESYYSLRDSIYKKHLGLKYYYELDRAEIHIQMIDYVILKYKDNDSIREQKIKANVEALAKINARLALGLQEITLEPDVTQLEMTSSDILDSEILRGATVNFADLENSDEELEIATPQATKTPVVSEKVEPSYLDLVADDPLMKATLLEEQKAKWREGVGLSPERQMDTVLFSEREKMRGEYAKERTLAIELRSKFKEAETNYQTRLKEFYENRSIFNRASGAIRTLFGSKPKLPLELVKLQTIQKYIKEQYALQLRDAWVKRAGAFVGNKVLDEAKPSIKKAFAEKFVLEPRSKLLEVQAEAYEKVAQNSKFKPIMSFVRKHRTALRWLGFGIASGTGAVAGGALLAGFNMARWGISTFGGAAAAAGIYKLKQKGVNEAISNINLEKEKVENEFTLAKLNELDESLAFTDLEVERTKLRQKVYAVGAAVAFGGATNVGASLVDTISLNEVTPGSSGETSTITGDISAEEAPILVDEKRVSEIQESVRKINEAVAKDNARLAIERMGVSYKPTGPLNNEVPLNLEVTPQTLLQMSGVKVPHYSLNGELLSQTTVSNIRLQGANTEALLETTLPQAKVIEIYSHLNYKINDLLSARPNFSQVELEKELFNELQNIYGGEEWWRSAKINEVKIGLIEVVRPNVAIPTSESGNLTADVGPEDSIPPGEAVTAGRTLVGDNPQGKSNTPLIDQPDSFLGKEPIIYTRSGGLSIDADNEVRSVPILKNTFVEYNPTESINAEAMSTKEINHWPLERTESRLVPPDPDLYTNNGNYTESREFKTYLNSEYGSVERFNKILLNQALAVEDDTYDMFNKWLNEYQSPYKMSLAKMTIGDLKEAFGGPELGSRVVEVDSTGLPKQYNTEAIRQYASTNNFNYETVRKWLVTLEDLKHEFPHQNGTTLEDLFARSLIKADLLALKMEGISV